MSSIAEKAWLKWVAVGVSFLVMSIAIGTQFYSQYKIEKAAEQKANEEFDARRQYEDSFRISMTRIYQNLRLDHFLAAYQNVNQMIKPEKWDRERVDEFAETVARIGRGLMQTGFLKEAEAMFVIVREFHHESKEAGDGLTEVESRRKLTYARGYLEEAKRNLDVGKYRQGFAELQKAEIELNSIRSQRFVNVDKEFGDFQNLVKDARFLTRIDDAKSAVAKARNAFGRGDYNATQDEMVKAANLTGRAAFLRPDSPDVAQVRQALRDLDAELAIAVPNSMPIYNFYSKEQLGRTSEYFHLDSYQFNIEPTPDQYLSIALNYQRTRGKEFYVVRYRFFVEDGRDFFNGHFLMPREDQKADDELMSVIFQQEVPERFRGLPIERVEVGVYDESNNLVSKVMRAFKTKG